MSFKRCTADYGSLSLKAMSCSEDDNEDLLESCETSDSLYYGSLSLGAYGLYPGRLVYLCGQMAIG